jgi:hypothetical protein
MRVKLSYTIDVEDILKETAKILNLSGEDLQQGANLFSAIQAELRGDDDDASIPNTAKALEMIKEMRTALLNVDTRLSEVAEIVEGYIEYQQRRPLDDALAPRDEAENTYTEDIVGAE